MRIFKFKEMTKVEKILLLGIFLTNIGNAIHILCLAKFLYNQTGSSLSFGGTIVLEQIFAFALCIVAGPFVDRHCPMKTVIGADLLRGIFICFFSYLIFQTSSFIWISLMIATIQIGKPFYKSGIFSSEILFLSEHRRPYYNSTSASISQTGAFVGMAIAGLIISKTDPRWGLFINGLSFIFSSFTVIIASKHHHKSSLSDNSKNASDQTQILSKVSFTKRFSEDWMIAIKSIKEKKKLVPSFLFAGLDIALPQVFNVLLIPMVFTKLNNNSFWISFLDSCFAIGAVLAGFIVGSFIHKKGVQLSALSGVCLQGLSFLLIALFNHPSVLIFSCLMNGAGNTASWSAWQTWLQSHIPKQERGRLSVIRHMIASLVTAGCVSLVSLLEHFSFLKAAFMATLIPFLSIFAMFYFFQISFFSKLKTNLLAGGQLWK